MTANGIELLIGILEEILQKQRELDAGVTAWNDEEADPCDMASCDPSDQYILGEEIEQLWTEVKDRIQCVQ